MHPFGNDPAKIERYRAFWSRAEARRPLVGFSLAGWFPLEEFAAARRWDPATPLTPELIRPEEFLEDQLRLLAEGESMDDDLIRGACPAQAAIPWLPGILGCTMRVLPGSVLGEDRHLSWDEALAVRLDLNHAWFRKYVEFADILVRAADGRFPVSHAPDLGPTDLHALLRGHTRSILDLGDEPELSARLLGQLGEIFGGLFERLWERLPRFHGGCFDAQYSLWSPDSIIRMQEDATAAYSPAFYRRLVQSLDRRLAGRFASSFIHLHSTSMFLLDRFLEIGEIQCFEVNQEASGPPVARMVPYFQRIQQAGKPLLIRGVFKPQELRLLIDSLEPGGLFLLLMVGSLAETEPLRPIVGL